MNKKDKKNIARVVGIAKEYMKAGDNYGTAVKKAQEDVANMEKKYEK